METIRFYEREGLCCSSPARLATTASTMGLKIERFAFIRHCRSLDMALDEIRVLLRLKGRPQQSCEAVNQVLDEHIGHGGTESRNLKAPKANWFAPKANAPQERDVARCGIL